VAWAQYKKYNVIIPLTLSLSLSLSTLAHSPFSQWKKKVSYFPLGLEELEDGMELQASTTFRGHEEDEDDEGEKENQKAKNSSIFDDSDDEAQPAARPVVKASPSTRTTTTTTTTTTSSPAVVDNEFNPRSRDSKKDSGDILNL